MRRFLFLLVSLLGLSICGLAAPAGPPRRARRPSTLPNQWVVRFAPRAALGVQSRLHALAGARVVSGIPQLGIQTVRLANPAAARAYSAAPGVLWIEPVRMRYPLWSPPNDPAYNQHDTNLAPFSEDATWFEWDARIIRAEEGWRIWPGRYFDRSGKGRASVRIAVIDTGIDYDHPDFRNAGAVSSRSDQGGQLDRSLDRTIFQGTNVPEARDAFGHGTHVAGIAAAATHNRIGVTGNGYNATVMSVKVLDAAGNGTSSDVAQAIVYAADRGALICNLSLGDFEYSQAEQDAVNYAWSKGTLVIAAAGNDAPTNRPNYPAALSRVLAVAATAREERPATYSNSGPYVGLAAPGGDWDFGMNWLLPVYSTMPTYDVTMNGPDYGFQKNYDYSLGTSMAAPQVAGLAALYAGSRGYTQRTPNVCLKLWQALQLGCDDISGGSGGWDPYVGFGRISVYGTMNLAAQPNPRGARAGCITGQVRFRSTPVANASIRAVPARGGTAVTAASRPDGLYRIANAPAGLYNVTVTVFGQSRTVQGVPVTAGCDTPGVDIDVGGSGGGPPAAPASLRAEPAGSTGIRLTWADRSSNEHGFRIERRFGTEAWKPLITVGEDSTEYTDASLRANTLYYYRVRAYHTALGESGWSNEASARTGSGPPPAPARLTAAAVSASQVNLAWQDRAANEDEYLIERQTGQEPFRLAGRVPRNTTAFAATALRGGTLYRFRVRARNSSGLSAPSNTASATTH